MNDDVGVWRRLTGSHYEGDTRKCLLQVFVTDGFDLVDPIPHPLFRLVADSLGGDRSPLDGDLIQDGVENLLEPRSSQLSSSTSSAALASS